MKKWWSSLFVWLVDVVLRSVWVLHRNSKDGGNECLPLLVFRTDVVHEILLKYSKQRRLSLTHVKIQNIPSNDFMMTQSITRFNLSEKQDRCKVFK